MGLVAESATVPLSLNITSKLLDIQNCSVYHDTCDDSKTDGVVFYYCTE